MDWSLVIYMLPLVIFVASTCASAAHRRASSADARGDGRRRLDRTRVIASAHRRNMCLGCGACVKACPETSHHDVLGLINGKAVLIGPSDCIGHGACKTACPFDAITLVFGTERRGLDIPVLKPTFESNVPGIYVAGELGGMGLIKNALTQAGRHSRRSPRPE